MPEKSVVPDSDQALGVRDASPDAAAPKKPRPRKSTPKKAASAKPDEALSVPEAAQAKNQPLAQTGARVTAKPTKASTSGTSANVKSAPKGRAAKKTAPQKVAPKANSAQSATSDNSMLHSAAQNIQEMGALDTEPAKPEAAPRKTAGKKSTGGVKKSVGQKKSAKAAAAVPDAEAQPPQSQNLPEVKAENSLVVIQENLPAVHTENLPARVEDTLGEDAPKKNGRRSRPRSRKNRASSAESAQMEEMERHVAAPEDAEENDDTAINVKLEDTDKRAATHPKTVVKARRKMFVSVLAGEQVEVVIAEEGGIREYYVEMLHQAKIKGNIYKGVIHNVDPNLQAAFVSYGASKNGFLQIDEVHPEYYLTPHESGKGHKYPLMQKVLKAGQEILVQVVKEPSGTKGAFLTSYLSIPGRYLVLTPGREQIGVSRKVGNDTERERLRDVLNTLNPGPGLGVIVRTVSEGAGKTNLQRDLRFLKRIWTDVRKKGSTEEAPALIYQELGLAARAVRDYLTEDIAELWVDDENMADEMREVIDLLFPKRVNMLNVYKEQNQTLFERFGLARQITQVQSREVVLPSGGRLVFDHTEALTAIDINSGRSGGKSNFEDMAFKINLEAAQNIPLQLRLRDIGGQVVVDFIEMRDRNHWREVEKAFRQGMKEDRARHDVGKISSFGLLEVVRQRLGSSAISIASEPCPFCNGTGIRRNLEWQAMQALQEIQQLIRQNNENGKTLVYEAAGELVLYLLNNKKERLLEMEQDANIKLELRPGI